MVSQGQRTCSWLGEVMAFDMCIHSMGATADMGFVFSGKSWMVHRKVLCTLLKAGLSTG